MPTETRQRLSRLRVGSLKPSRIDLYLLSEVAGPFLGSMLLFMFIFLMFQLLRLAEFFIVHGVSLPILGRMTALLTLQFLPMTLPVAFLLSVLVAFGRLSSDSELVALKASGLSLLRLSAPVLAFAVAVSTVSLKLNQDWAPWGETASKDLLIRVSNTKVASAIKEGTFTSGFFDLLIFADKVDSKTSTLKKVFIFDERQPKNPLTVVARSGEIVSVKTRSELGSAIMLKLYDGSIHSSDKSEKTYSKMDFEKYRLYLKIDEGSPNTSWKPNMIPQKDLVRIIGENPPRSQEGREMRGEYWRRYAVAATPLFFVFLGIGFGTVRTRAIRAGAALIAFVTLLAYWTVLTYSTLLVYRGTLPPVLAMQLPNLAVLVAAAISFRRAMW